MYVPFNTASGDPMFIHVSTAHRHSADISQMMKNDRETGGKRFQYACMIGWNNLG